LVEDGPEGKGAQSDGTQFKQEAKRSACTPKIEEEKALTGRSLCGGSASTKGGEFAALFQIPTPDSKTAGEAGCGTLTREGFLHLDLAATSPTKA
jgi:hypothetical protein